MVDGGAISVWVLCWRGGRYVQSLADGDCASSSVCHLPWHWRLPHSPLLVFFICLVMVLLLQQGTVEALM